MDGRRDSGPRSSYQCSLSGNMDDSGIYKTSILVSNDNALESAVEVPHPAARQLTNKTAQVYVKGIFHNNRYGPICENLSRR